MAVAPPSTTTRDVLLMVIGWENPPVKLGRKSKPPLVALPMLSMTRAESSPSAESLEMPRKPCDKVTEPKNELLLVTLNPLVFDGSPLNVIVAVESESIPPARVTRELRLFPVEKRPH